MSNVSSVSSGLLKLAYRGIAGFFVALFLFVFGVVGIALSFAGGLVVALSWVPLAVPEVTDYIMVMGDRSVLAGNPTLGAAVMLLVGLLLLGIGFFFLVITYMIGKGAIVVDRGLSRAVDRTFGVSSRGDWISQLERLAVLRDQGVITEAEFQRERAYIMGQPYKASMDHSEESEFIKHP